MHAEKYIRQQAQVSTAAFAPPPLPTCIDHPPAGKRHLLPLPHLLCPQALIGQTRQAIQPEPLPQPRFEESGKLHMETSLPGPGTPTCNNLPVPLFDGVLACRSAEGAACFGGHMLRRITATCFSISPPAPLRTVPLRSTAVRSGEWLLAVYNPLPTTPLGFALTVHKVGRCLHNCSGHGRWARCRSGGRWLPGPLRIASHGLAYHRTFQGGVDMLLRPWLNGKPSAGKPRPSCPPHGSPPLPSAVPPFCLLLALQLHL